MKRMRTGLFAILLISSILLPFALATPASVESITDPTGDTFNSGPDITSFSADLDNDELILNMGITGSDPIMVVGYIDLDVDQNSDTGGESNTTHYSPYTSGLGVEYAVMFIYGFEIMMAENGGGGEGMAWLSMYTPEGYQEVGELMISGTQESLTIRVPLSMLSDDGCVNMATVIGLEGPTDAAPNGGYISTCRSRPVPTWYSIYTNTEPDGSGTVEIVPDRLAYQAGESVQITATAAQGYTFDHWSGDLSGSDPSQTITVDFHKSATAHFELEGGTLLGDRIDDQGRINQCTRINSAGQIVPCQ